MLNRTSLVVIGLTVMSLTSSTAALAEPGDATTASGIARKLAAPARDVIHAEWATFGLANGITLNYEHLFNDNLAVRVGYGASSVFWMTGGKSAHGPLAMLTLLLGDTSNFELSAGLSIIEASDEPMINAATLGADWYLSPNAFAGYRYQADDGGLVARVGLGWTTGFGAIATLGVGHAF